MYISDNDHNSNLTGGVIYYILQAGYVRPRIRWMAKADDYILELLRAADIVANPSTIAFNIDYNLSYISSRCQRLDEAGLVDRKDETKSMYAITDLGVRYLDGELTDEQEQRLQDAL